MKKYKYDNLDNIIRSIFYAVDNSIYSTRALRSSRSNQINLYLGDRTRNIHISLNPSLGLEPPFDVYNFIRYRGGIRDGYTKDKIKIEYELFDG